MEIPFAGTVFGRRVRGEAALDLIETAVASPMSAVKAAIPLPQNRLARWRSRRLT
jgi:hypothetical protein